MSDPEFLRAIQFADIEKIKEFYIEDKVVPMQEHILLMQHNYKTHHQSKYFGVYRNSEIYNLLLVIYEKSPILLKYMTNSDYIESFPAHIIDAVIKCGVNPLFPKKPLSDPAFTAAKFFRQKEIQRIQNRIQFSVFGRSRTPSQAMLLSLNTFFYYRLYETVSKSYIKRRTKRLNRDVNINYKKPKETCK